MTWHVTKTPLIAILRGITPDEIHQHLPVLIDAGFDAIEIPLNSPNWQESIQIAVESFGTQALIGAGTVLAAPQVEQIAQLGGKLIVTPNINQNVIKAALQHDLVVCPGCMTATEAFNAIELGCRNLKIFPSSAVGPAYIKALKAVLPPEVAVFAVGGVTPDNLHDYLNAGCAGAGLGSDLYRAGQSVEQTKQQAEAFIRALNQFKK